MENVGFRIYEQFMRAPLSLIEQFRNIPVANIGDNMGRIYCVNAAIRPFNSLPLLGAASTVKVPAGDNLMFHRAIDLCQPGDILVIDGGGYCERALCGEQMFRYAATKGIAGMVVDGAIRDVESLKAVPFPVYARSVSPNGPYKNGPGEINVPISIGGMVVFPGDIAVGDADGVIFVRPQHALEIAQKAVKQNEAELLRLSQIEDGTADKSWITTALQQKKCSVHTGSL